MSNRVDHGEVNPFKSWLDAERGRASALAAFAGCFPSHVASIAAGRRKPSAELLRSILEFAEGALTIDDVLWPWRDDFRSVHDTGLAANDTGALPQSSGDCEAAS